MTAGYITYGSGDTVRDQFGNTQSSVLFKIYDSRIGGAQVLDLLDLNGNPYDTYVPSLTAAQAPTDGDAGRLLFQAPDTYGALWAQPPPDSQSRMPARWLLLPDDVGTRLNTAIQNASDAITAVNNIADTSGQMAAINSRIDNVETQQNQINTTAAMITDLQCMARIPGSWVSSAWVQSLPNTAAYTFYLWVAQVPCSVTTMDFVFDQWDKSGGGTNHWVISANRIGSDGVSHQFVSKSTSGNVITHGVRWSLTPSTWDTTQRVFAAGDIMSITFTVSGAPAAALLPANVTWGYQPT